MENIIQLHKIDPKGLGSIIREIVKEELQPIIALLKNQRIKEDELLTRKEAAEFLKISNTTLYTLDKTQVLPAKRLRGKVLYLKSDLLSFDR
jgi:excisionase family DNA binding protein